MVPELPDDAQRWTAAERELAVQVLLGRTVVVNVRRGGPHRHLVPWLLGQGMISRDSTKRCPQAHDTPCGRPDTPRGAQL